MTLPVALLFEFWKACEPCPVCDGTGLVGEFDDTENIIDDCGDCEVLEAYIKEHHPELVRVDEPADPDEPCPF